MWSWLYDFHELMGNRLGWWRILPCKDQSVLNKTEFYDVYWTKNYPTDSEKQAFKIKSSTKAKEVMETFPSLKDLIYQLMPKMQPAILWKFASRWMSKVSSSIQADQWKHTTEPLHRTWTINNHTTIIIAKINNNFWLYNYKFLHTMCV